MQIFAPIKIVYDRNHPTLFVNNNYHFVLYKGAIIVSVAQVELLNATDAVLRSLATDEPYKKLGYGTYVVKLLEKWVRQQGINIFKMHTNLKAKEFYRKLGYSDILFDEPCINPKHIILGKILK